MNKPIDEITFDLPVDPSDYECPDDLPCYRQLDPTDGEWQCCFDHTGCLWNDGSNTCMNDAETSWPMGWTCPECEEQNGEYQLFCSNNPGPSKMRAEDNCTGKHPAYWQMTADWPIRTKKPPYRSYL